MLIGSLSDCSPPVQNLPPLPARPDAPTGRTHVGGMKRGVFRPLGSAFRVAIRALLARRMRIISQLFFILPLAVFSGRFIALPTVAMKTQN